MALNTPDLIKEICKEANISPVNEPGTEHYLSKRQLEQLLLHLKINNDKVKELQEQINNPT